MRKVSALLGLLTVCLGSEVAGAEGAPLQAGGQAAPSPMQAGGLAPPPPIGSSSPSPTVARLEEARHHDSGRGLEWVVFDVHGELEHTGLATFSSEGLLGNAAPEVGTGFSVRPGLALRLLFLTIGARAAATLFSDFTVVRLGGELGARLPLGNLEPHVALGAGYATFTLDGVASPNGVYGRLSAGLDYYVTPRFSLGAGLAFDLTSWSDGAVTSGSERASSLGGTASIGASAGLHF